MEKIGKIIKVADMSKQEKKTTEARFCEKHKAEYIEGGEYNHKTQSFPWYCQECENERKAQEEATKLSARCLKYLNLPKRLQSYDFTSFVENKDNKKAKGVCTKFVKDYPNTGGLVMLGGVGAGKTHLATAICQNLASGGVMCKITTVNKIVRNFRSVWGNKTVYYQDGYSFEEKEKTETTIIKDYCDLDLLVIDEIGSQYGSDSEKIIVNEIINNRYEDMKPTIVMGNVTVSELNSILGERVVDRLTHNGHLLFFEWESMRNKVKN